MDREAHGTCSTDLVASIERASSLTRTIISLTTIPPRIPYLGPTLRSLLSQSAAIDSVMLWIPERYRRSEFSDVVISDLPPEVEICRCQIDYGPATKVLPAIQRFSGQDVRIIYCDDDRIYHAGWAAGLMSESDRYPEDCICEAGEKVEVTALRALGHTWKYKLFTTLTLGYYGHLHRSKIRALDPGRNYVDIAKGYGGVLVRPSFIPLTAFDAPEPFWTVDDIWLSGQMTVNGVKIRKLQHENSAKTKAAEISALIDFVHEGQDRNAANLNCIRHFQEQHRIWARGASSRSPSIT